MEELKKGKNYIVPSILLTIVIVVKMYYSGMIPELLSMVGVGSSLSWEADNMIYVTIKLMFLDFMIGMVYTKVNSIRKEEKVDMVEALDNGLKYVLTLYVMQILFVTVGTFVLLIVVKLVQNSPERIMEYVLGVSLGLNFLGVIVRIVFGKGVLAYLVHNQIGKTKYKDAVRFAFKNFKRILKTELQYFKREIWGVLFLGIGYVFTKARALSYKTEDWEVMVNGKVEEGNLSK